MGELYKHTDEGEIKMMVISTCNFLHHRKMTEVVKAPEFHEDIEGYFKVRNGAISFLLGLLESHESLDFKQAAAESLYRIFLLICNDTLMEANSRLFYQPSEDQFRVLYQFIDHEIGIPLMGLSE